MFLMSMMITGLPQPGEESRYRPTDRVYYRESPSSAREGPFLIETKVPGAKRYTLCYENGQKAKVGREVDEAKLESVPGP